MAEKPTTILTLKLLVDTKAQRVLYAEAGKDVIDFLFSFLAFPLGAVTKLLTAGTMVGSVGNLYGSVEKLDADYVCRRDAKIALLSPAVQLGAPEASTPKPNGLYRCKGCSFSNSLYNYATKVSGTPCPVCKGKMTMVAELVEPDDKSGGATTAVASDEASSSKGYVRGMVTYTVMDDLSVAPMCMSTISVIDVLVALGVTDISGIQEKTMEVGDKEGLAMLESSLKSKTVLTDVFLGAKQMA